MCKAFAAIKRRKKTFSSKVAQFHDDTVYQSCHTSQMLVQKIVKYVVYVNHYGYTYDTPKVVHLLLSVATQLTNVSKTKKLLVISYFYYFSA